MTKENKEEKEVIGIVKLNKARLTFPELFEPKAFQGQGEAKYSAGFLIGKKSPQIAEIKQVIKEVAAAKWGAKADAVLKSLYANDKVCLRDGDIKSEYQGFEGNYFINATNKARPTVKARDGKTPLTAADGVIYSGCNANGSIQIWAQENQFGKRINASLRWVQFHSDNDAFSGSAPRVNDDEFEDLSDGADADDLA